ncbi:MAG: DNA cytosine methyltransferase [Hyphomonadaceae bacterium]|nr:DNA cytosine methyltransferase [Hyphomonadaceae bacterium]
MEILSLFCGCGGLDRGFEDAGFHTALAYDRRESGLNSWRTNRKNKKSKALNRDISKLTITQLDKDYGSEFLPRGVIGGPPCQGFSIANRFGSKDDARNQLVDKFFNIALRLHKRSELDFILMENVPAIAGIRGGDILEKQKKKLSGHFDVHEEVLDAQDYGVAQRRRRLFLVAISTKIKNSGIWSFPEKQKEMKNVRDVIGSLPEPVFFNRSIEKGDIPFHPNHWCMTPKSPKFKSGELVEGYKDKRSFRTLSWDEPSYTASYGNREVHVHPNGHRRLSVLEAMLIQGFKKNYKLSGTLSDQITQVSEALPPPLAFAVSLKLRHHLLTATGS